MPKRLAPAPAVSGMTPECQHKLTKESEFCLHGYAMGTTCKPCIVSCPECWDMYSSASSFGPRPSAPVASAPTCNKGFPSVAGMRTCRLPLGHAFAHHSRPGDPDDFTWANDEAVTLSSTASAPKDETKVERALAFVAEFQGDARCSLNAVHAEALAAEIHRLRAQLVADFAEIPSSERSASDRPRDTSSSSDLSSLPSARTVTCYRVIACGHGGEVYTSVEGKNGYEDFPAETIFVLASEVDPLLTALADAERHQKEDYARAEIWQAEAEKLRAVLADKEQEIHARIGHLMTSERLRHEDAHAHIQDQILSHQQITALTARAEAAETQITQSQPLHAEAIRQLHEVTQQLEGAEATIARLSQQRAGCPSCALDQIGAALRAGPSPATKQTSSPAPLAMSPALVKDLRGAR